MLSSIFENWEIAFWIDYSKREDCVEVVNFTQEQIEKLQNGCKYENGEIVETPEYLEKQMKAEIREADKTFQKAVQELTSEYTPEEVMLFIKEETEAKKVIEDENYISEFLNGYTVEWETIKELAEKIIANANAYSIAYTSLKKTLREKTKEIREKYLVIN